MISIFYHIWAPKDDALVRLLIDEQIKKLQTSHLISNSELFIGINGASSSSIQEYLSGYNTTILPDDDAAESHTLQMLYNHCQSLSENRPVFYFHTKGLSHFYDEGCHKNKKQFNKIFKCVNSWRHFMEYHTISQWRVCVDKLKEFDTVGPNHCKHFFNHYSGNFWWANSSFISHKTSPLIHSTTKGHGKRRHRAESWILCDGGSSYDLGYYSNTHETYLNDRFDKIVDIMKPSDSV